MVVYAKSGPEWTLLIDHLKHVADVAKKITKHLGLNEDIAYIGAILHDLGKAHPEFQNRLFGKSNMHKIFRHEIASMFFISIFPIDYHKKLIEMVIGHHKSVKTGDGIGEKGLLDLYNCEENFEEFHLGEWEVWSVLVYDLLNELGIETKIISRTEALENLQYVVDFCKKEIKVKGISEWRGILMGADHFASALINSTEKESKKSFINPNLNFFSRKHHLYPLSHIDTNVNKKHTLVVACTGAGKTDFLFRRCKGRVFYTLPYQASINAMFKRVANDLKKDNPDLDIRVLHASSSIIKIKNIIEEEVMQSLIGSSVKILTPHQLSSIVFGLKGYESMMLDLKGSDVILDEIHTYTGVSQAIVIKLVEILKAIGCNIHIGTATMPKVLYNKILEILGDDVYEVSLPVYELEKFNRHKIFKIESFNDSLQHINTAVRDNKKVLIVANTVPNAQRIFDSLQNIYPSTEILLLHSRFKRKDRNIKEKSLIGLDDTGVPTNEFNTSNSACIVVATQIVEVSLDISFDVMITECAPLDALIQRIGRINRIRNDISIGKIENVYVIAPPDNEKSAKPYDLDILRRTYDVLPNGEILEEKMLQEKIDSVFPTLNIIDINEHAIYKSDGTFNINKLTHRKKSILFELLQIDSVVCICESDVDEYETSNYETRLGLEIPIRYNMVSKKKQSNKGNKPFIIPDNAYTDVRGVINSMIK